MSKPRVVYQDEGLAVVFKPGGWVSIASSIEEKKSALSEWIWQKGISRLPRGGLVHRLDKDTWGLLLVAKTQSVFVALQRQFKKRRVDKIYWALVEGAVPEKGVVRAPIGQLPWNRRKWGVVPLGKQAETKWRVLKRLGSRSLIEVYPKTGRTHQIRVHFHYLGYPIVGDRLYGQGRSGELLWLLAKKLAFEHPTTGKQVVVEISVPTPLAKILSKSGAKIN